MFKNIIKVIKIIVLIIVLGIAIVGCSGGHLSSEFKKQKDLIIKLSDEIIRNDYQQTHNSNSLMLELTEECNLHSFKEHKPKTDAEKAIQNKSYELLNIYHSLPYSPSYIGINNGATSASSYTRQAIREIKDYVLSIK